MSDPVLMSDGYTYDRATAEKIMEQKDPRSPMTRLPVSILAANLGLRSAIWEAFPELQKKFVKPSPTFSGSLDADGLASGQGKRTFANGTIEDGLFEKGELRQGSRVISSGNRDTGTFVGGVLHGEGARAYAIGHKAGQQHTGRFHEGEFVRGQILYRNGDLYRGDVRHGKFHGEGEFIAASGSKVSGQFVNGKLNGFGTVAIASQYTHVGQFELGKPHGQGTRTNANGDTYQGNWVENELREGAMSYGDLKYEGQFRNYRMHGRGVLANLAKGRKYEGEFKQDKMHGMGIFHEGDGSHYEGSFSENEKNGAGTRTSSSGRSKVDCVYERGKLISARGTWVKTDGTTLTGVLDPKTGVLRGTQRLPDGKEMKGSFKHGELVPKEKHSMKSLLRTIVKKK